MGKKKNNVADLVIPPQDNRICATICICQMVLILSTVSIVYLTVAIYVPSAKAIQSGISEVPCMCTTTKAINRDSCSWGSCGEWCLSKTSGACIQIHVHLRNNGSSLIFQNCTTSANKTCYGIDQENAKKARCIADECKNLTGTFNCTAGMCINITDAFECIFHNTDPPLKCSGRRGKITCSEIEGLFSCNRGTCEKIRTPYNCDRRCVDIPTRNKNVILLNGDKVFLSQCSTAINDSSQMEVWNEMEDNVLMASCFLIQNTTRGIEASDCVNGAVLDKIELTDLTNFTYLSFLHVTHAHPNKGISPLETDLTISNDSKLMINLEGCVNTLQDECKDFLKNYGKDGSDHNARARFPCFYSEKNPEIVVARFDLETTYQQFMIATLLPIVLMIVSCITLTFCQRTVHVGDDAKMRFKACGGDGLIKNELDDDTMPNMAGERNVPGDDSAMAL
jgi:hypothetical protein